MPVAWIHMDCAAILGVRVAVIRVRVLIRAIRAGIVLAMLSAPRCDALATSQRHRYPRLW